MNMVMGCFARTVIACNGVSFHLKETGLRHFVILLRLFLNGYSRALRYGSVIWRERIGVELECSLVMGCALCPVQFLRFICCRHRCDEGLGIAIGQMSDCEWYKR